MYEISSQAFAFIDTLEYVSLSYTVTSVGYGAFAMCTNLKTVVITNYLGFISDAAFGGCEKLKTVYFVCGTEEITTWEDYCGNCVNQDSFENEACGFGNKYLCEVPNVYYYSEEPITDGHHWYFNDDNEPQLWS